MNIRRYVGTVSVAATLAFGLAGSAFASPDVVSLDNATTGTNSKISIKLDNSSTSSTTNVNSVHLSNVNIQGAETGKVNATDNTSVGGLGGSLESGNASNENSTVNAVGVSNDAPAVVPGDGNGNGNGNGGSGNSTGAVGGSGNGSVLGASTGGLGGGGAAVLPEVGASIPMDVSALRAAWHPQTNAATADLAKGSRMFTAAMLITATLLSLLGALGSAFYTRRRQVRV